MKIPSFDTQPKDKAYSGYGKAMLSKMGWKEGDGLGKNRQGMAEAIKVKKREHQEGLGAEASHRAGVQAVGRLQPQEELAVPGPPPHPEPATSHASRKSDTFSLASTSAPRTYLSIARSATSSVASCGRLT